MNDSLTIAVIQKEITPHDPPGNLLSALRLLNACLDRGIDLFVMSELWSTGLLDADDLSLQAMIETIDGPTISALADFCRQSNAFLLAGTIPLIQNGIIGNTSVLINPSGQVSLKYSKIHLFPEMSEDEIFAPGKKMAATEINGVKVGVLVCYDLRFPNLFRSLAKAGCEVILIPALWPETRIYQWETLLRARAIENQVYIVGANGVGNQWDYFFPGHSLIVGPEGEALNTPDMRESVIERKLDIKKLREIRSYNFHINREQNIDEVDWQQG